MSAQNKNGIKFDCQEFAVDLDTVTANYRMGLISPMEYVQQVDDIVTSKKKTLKDDLLALVELLGISINVSRLKR